MTGATIEATARVRLRHDGRLDFRLVLPKDMARLLVSAVAETQERRGITGGATLGDMLVHAMAEGKAAVVPPPGPPQLRVVKGGKS